MINKFNIIIHLTKFAGWNNFLFIYIVNGVLK